MIRIKYIVIVFFLFCNSVYGQQNTDTATLIKDFTKIMSFTSQPYLYYTTTTKMSAEPVLESMDTLSMTGEFFKNNTEIYSSTRKEEMYLQDSLMIEINNDRKTIWVRKVDMATKMNLNILPVNTGEMLDKFRKDYVISKSTVSDGVSRLNFEERKQEHNTSATTTFVTVEYSEKTYLPQVIEILIELKQPADEQVIDAIKTEGLDESKLIKMVDGVKQLVRKQKVSIVFTSIDYGREKLAKMPSYKSNFEFDVRTQEFSGKGLYRDYEVTKTF